MTVDYTDFDEVAHQDKLHFFYDAQSRPAQVKFNGAVYTYVHNLQGDIVGLLDSAGALVVEYKYDAWGKPISTTGNLADTLGKRNPFRYLSYVYDEETGLYYLRSRYYNPVIGRFVNADAQIYSFDTVADDNLYSYCGNDPVIRLDPTGKAWWHWAIGAAIVVACAAAVVITAGGAMAGAVAVSAVANGMAASTTASTIAAGAFIGSSVVYGSSVLVAASESSSVHDFNQRGNWGTVASTAGGGMLGAAYGHHVARSSKLTYHSRGSTGRTTPNNLREQLAMEQVKSDPLAGAKKLPFRMTNPRWPSEEGWIKMANNVKGMEIHFVYNPRYHFFDDFKFK